MWCPIAAPETDTTNDFIGFRFGGLALISGLRSYRRTDGFGYDGDFTLYYTRSSAASHNTLESDWNFVGTFQRRVGLTIFFKFLVPVIGEL